jgi:hypothetical protein
LLELAAGSSKLTPHARTALRLTLLQITNRLEARRLVRALGRDRRAATSLPRARCRAARWPRDWTTHRHGHRQMRRRILLK